MTSRGLTQTHTRKHAAGLVWACGLVMLPWLWGCPFQGVPEALTPYDLETDPDGDGSLATARPVQWNGDVGFAAGGISVDPGNLLTIKAYLGGQILGNNMPSPSEVDVFSLGQLDAGDQVSVSVASLMQSIVNLTPLGQADIVKNVAGEALMLVDSNSEIVGYPAAQPVPIGTAGEYFLVVQSFVPGDYTFTIDRLRGLAAPPARPAVCLVQFGGGSDLDSTFINATGQLVYVSELPAFDFDATRPDLPGQSARFQETVRQFIEYIFADWNVTVTLDPEQARAAGNYDTVVFTAPSAEELGLDMKTMWTLGIEPMIDVENQASLVGIIFIQAFEEARYLDFNSYAAMWASVAAHEYGHAVGLWHVAQVSDTLMTPSLSGPQRTRAIRTLARAVKEEADAQPLITLYQDPDRYLSRVIGPRDPKAADVIRARTRSLLPAGEP